MIDDNIKPATRRIIATPSIIPPSTVAAPQADQLIEDALHIISSQLVNMRAKVNAKQTLNAEDGRLLNGFVKSLVELSKEARERDKDANNPLAGLSLNELMDLVQGKHVIEPEVKK